MKAEAKNVIVSAYNLVVSDEMLSQEHARNRGASRESVEKLRAKILEERITTLIGTADQKDSFFIYGRGTVRYFFGSRASCANTNSSHAKRTAPEGPFDHRSIKEVIIKTIFTASKGLDCLADAFDDEDNAFNPVPLETIALAATAV